jgi:DNA-directed RNA polymerase specialized sigma24 family protein
MRVDEVAIREFLHTAYPRLVAAVALACQSRPAAEDAVQEALLRAWERSEKGTGARLVGGVGDGRWP